MTDQRSEHKPPPSPESLNSKPFSLGVTIKDLPYTFAGTIPQKPSDDFIWKIHVPSWKEISPLVHPDFRRSSQFDQFETTGQIGALYVNGVKDILEPLYLSKLESNAELFPEDSPYHEARGIGGFLLNQLLALADARGLSIEAYIQAEGRLSDQDMKRWFNNVGFSYNEHGGGDFIRKPAAPDFTQPIMSLLQAEAS